MDKSSWVEDGIRTIIQKGALKWKLVAIGHSKTHWAVESLCTLGMYGMDRYGTFSVANFGQVFPLTIDSAPDH
jgi:hypothetical protein